MNRIIELRKKHKLSQASLAEFVGCSQRSISHYENGTHKIPPEALAKLCTAFNVTADYLLGFSDENTKSPAANDSEAKSDSLVPPPTPEDQELFTRIQRANKLFLALDDAGKAQALAYLEFLEAQQSKAPEAQD